MRGIDIDRCAAQVLGSDRVRTRQLGIVFGAKPGSHPEAARCGDSKDVDVDPAETSCERARQATDLKDGAGGTELLPPALVSA
jgi:hypothetical protein